MLRRIAVCDDEKIMLRQISTYLDQWQKDNGWKLETFYFSSAEALLKSMDRNTDLVLLDISMGGMTGMDCAKTLRDEGFTGEFMFITSMENYALEGYKVHAFAFLTKPLVYDELSAALSDCRDKLAASAPAVFPVETSSGTKVLRSNDILYAEVFGRETSFALKSGAKVVSVIQLAAVEEQLGSKGFFRCHRSYLINLKHVENIAPPDITLTGGAVVPISKHRVKEFLSAYAKYIKSAR